MIVSLAGSIRVELDIEWIHSHGVQKDKKLACKYTHGETLVVGMAAWMVES